jgi:hypothetical protein
LAGLTHLRSESARVSVEALLDGLLSLSFVVKVVVAVGAVAVEAELAVGEAVAVPVVDITPNIIVNSLS